MVKEGVTVVRRCLAILLAALFLATEQVGTFAQPASSRPLVPFQSYGFQNDEYTVEPDSTVTIDGNATLSIAAVPPTGNAFGASAWSVDAAPYRGKRVSVKSVIRTAGVEG